MTSALELSAKRQLLLERLLRKQGVVTGARPAISRRAGSGPAPLSFGQQRLWFLHQLEPEGMAYNIPETVRLQGGLDATSLARALTEVTRRHEVLRTVYATLDGEPRQIVQPPAPVPLPLTRLSGLPAARREAEAGRIAAAFAAQPFDLARGPVLRAALVELDRDDHVLLLILHHIATDGWSMGLLVRELTRLYSALAGGAPTLLPELPLQYSDFATWQRGWLQGEALESQLRYWRQRLAGAPTQLALPVDRPWPAVQTSRGDRTAIRIGAGTAAGLRELAREHGVTLFMVLVGGLAALLQRITGQDDLLLGTPAAGRGQPEIEGLIGFFINTLVLRADLSDDPDVAALLSRLKETVLGADAHQDLPFERLVDALELPRDLSRSPLFQVMLAFQNLPPVEERPGTLAVLPFPFTARRAQFELHVSLGDAPGGLSGFLEYRSELFEAASARRLARHLESLLAGIARAPTSPVSRLPLLSPAEEQQLVHEWNDTTAAYAWPREHGGLHDLVAAQVARTPGAIAASLAGESLTYAELDARANRLARHLRSLGCGPETRVAIAMERSPELLVALLATLKSGGAYVPLDPDYPRERLAFMLDDARPAALLTQERLLPALPTSTAPILCLHPDGRESRDFASIAPGEHTDDLQLAYVIYTSGSTGRPKGAMVHHAGIRNRLLWMQEAYRLAPADTVLQKTPYSFDVSVWELFWPLLAGARVAFARPGEHRDAAALAARIAAEEVTTLHFVPSLLQVFLEERGLDRCRSLRRVVASGEALAPELVRRFHERLPGVALENLYGPTEASVDVTFHPCQPGGGDRAVPIGRPIANTRIHLMDRGGRPVPVGVAGELWIGGANVGRGYLGRPELTADRFVPDPLDPPESGSRLYRTGDLARHRPDGAVEYLGRIDHQVKLRGVRIELGEIESALLRHPEVREAAVAVCEDRGVRRLVGYVAPAAVAAAAAADELRRYLLERLPEAMVPALFVGLDALPLSPNGKLDRKALPTPDPATARSEVAFIAPESAAEAALAQAWSEILGVPQVGARDNFFALGGDSILSIRALARVRDLGWSLSLQQIFQHPTVRELARELVPADGAGSRAGSGGDPAPFSLLSAEDRDRLPGGLEDAYPLARLQAGTLFHSELDPESAVYHDISSVHLQAPYDAVLLRQAAEQVTALHPLLRTSFALTGYSEPLQLVHRDAAVDFAVDDLRHLGQAEQEETLAAWMENEKTQPLDWQRAPLLRFRVLRRGEETFQFILSFHHAILDGWSLAMLQADLIRIYLALIQRHEIAETPPPRSFRRFVALERETLSSAASGDYWRRQLAGLEATRLPRREPETGEQGSGVCLTDWPADLAAHLMAVARPLGVPIKSALLAAHARVLSALANRSGVVTGLVTNGRPEEDGADRALGLFLNTLPIRLATPGGTWNDLLRATFAAEREMLPHRHYPMAELLREAGGRPLFEPVFNFVHFHVHQSFSRHDEVRSLGGEFFDRTNFTFLANFNLNPFTSRLQLRIDYDPEAFPAAQIEAIAGYYDRALTALAEDPAGRYETSPLLSAAERTQVLQWGNDTARHFALPPCIHHIFETQADLTPDAPALEMAGEVWSYRELEERANRLAGLLRCRGVAVDNPVGICLDRSLALPVAVLAALKAGGAYLPLDPSYPLDRLAGMVEEAGLNLLLTGGSARERLPAGWLPQGVEVVGLDSRGEAGAPAAPGAPERPAAGATAGSLGYVLYTSGSTGRPKGVAMPHGALVNLIGWQLGGPRPERGLRTLQFTSLGFDPSFEEMLSTWGSGGTLVMITEEERRDPNVLLDFLIERRIGRVFQPFVALQQLAEAAAARAVFPAGLHDLVTAGEQLQITPAVAELFRRVPGCRLFNQYGPTETHVTTAALLSGDPGTWPSLPAIGRPIANHRVYLLDSHGEPAPPDAAGELFVAGAGLARGYLHRPDLTAERFVPDSFSGEPGARLYRTGDLARHLPGGELEFLGRADRQVKIRGYRVEPGEIEMVLSSHPAVREAAVVMQGDGPARRLVAFVVAAGTAPAAGAELAASLRGRLPEYMVPSAFLTVEALPLTPSGKVDRGELARITSFSDLPRPDLGQAFVAPRTPTEELLAGIWIDVLRVERVGVHDDFLEVGGHSLLALQLMQQVREKLGVHLPLHILYSARTVAALAVAVVKAQAEKADAELLAELLREVEQMPAETLRAALSAEERPQTEVEE